MKQIKYTLLVWLAALMLFPAGVGATDAEVLQKDLKIQDDGGVISAYYQLPGKEADINRFVLFKVNAKGVITLVYIEGDLDSDDLITILFTKKDL